MRARKWSRYAFGNSYQHVEQGRGRCFAAGQLEGYFNDLRGKADWRGATGAFGVPLVDTDTARGFAFPIAIFQWGLGNWDRWLSSGREDSTALGKAISAGRWALDGATDRGGWPCWTGLRRPVTSVYSAMAQGQALSLMSRLANLDDADELRLRECCERAYSLLVEAPGEGLVSIYRGSRVLEEYPGGVLRGVLNGWIFALVGIADYALLSQRQDVASFADECAYDLAECLSCYDSGSWSYYDLKGNLSSPFYHSLCIVQLRILAEIFPAYGYRYHASADAFESYARSPICKTKAIAGKVAQKLRQAEMGEIE